VLLETPLNWDEHAFGKNISFSEDSRLVVASGSEIPTRVLQLPAQAADLLQSANTIISKLSPPN
jgi:hypothetical protein